MPGPTRYCPSCYAPNAWAAEHCERCSGPLATVSTFDDRLIWALDHPDTATAMLAADLLVRRRVTRAVPALLRVVDSADPYRAQAAARALAAFRDDPRVVREEARLRAHASTLVRGAFRTGSPEPSAGRTE
jgi:putative intracellular protease/amidase